MATTQDVFDSLMNSTCNVLEKGTGSSEGYNQPSQALSLVPNMPTAIPCRLSTMKSGKEYKAGKELSINHYLVFMRPQTLPITAHNWLQITDGNGNVYTLNILSANDPGAMGHHLELLCEQVNP